MTSRRIANWIAACCLVACGAGSVCGQATDAFCDGCCEHDAQLFAPVDFDFDCMPIKDECGFFFNYRRLAWHATGERTTIGAKGLVVDSEQIYPQGPFDRGTTAATYPIINGIQDAPPNADVGWGHRYELGYFKGGNGWLVGVLDGPSVTSIERYGFEEIQIPNTLPLITGAAPLYGTGTPQIININPALNPLLVGQGAGSANLETARNGWGSVHVNFETPADLLKGWRDYTVNGTDNVMGPTTGGPGRVLVVTGAAATITNGVITSILITNGAVTQGADGIVDNIKGGGPPDNGTFYIVFIDTNGNGTQDDDEPIIGSGVDHNDLHTFNIRFINLTVRNTTRTDGIEIMRTIELDNSYLPVKEQRNHFDIAYGARFLKISDDFSWDGDIDTLGRTYQTTGADNQIVGPQIRARWTHQRERFTFGLDGRCLFGYNVQDLNQRGALFEDANPGAVNRPQNLQPTSLAYGRQDNFFSPVAELRADLRYQVTGALAAKLGYTGIFVDNISRASQLVRYRLPDLGILEGGKQNIFINGVDFGFDLVY